VGLEVRRASGVELKVAEHHRQEANKTKKQQQKESYPISYLVAS